MFAQVHGAAEDDAGSPLSAGVSENSQDHRGGERAVDSGPLGVRSPGELLGKRRSEAHVSHARATIPLLRSDQREGARGVGVRGCSKTRERPRAARQMMPSDLGSATTGAPQSGRLALAPESDRSLAGGGADEITS